MFDSFLIALHSFLFNPGSFSFSFFFVSKRYQYFTSLFQQKREQRGKGGSVSFRHLELWIPQNKTEKLGRLLLLKQTCNFNHSHCNSFLLVRTEWKRLIKTFVNWKKWERKHLLSKPARVPTEDILSGCVVHWGREGCEGSLECACSFKAQLTKKNRSRERQAGSSYTHF